MHLLTLPTELLQRIIQESIPESIEQLTLTCKHIHSAAQPYLGAHNKLRRRFRHFSYSRPYHELRGRRRTGKVTWDPPTAATGIKIKTAADLVREIALNPVVGRYLVSADLRRDTALLHDEWQDPEQDLSGVHSAQGGPSLSQDPDQGWDEPPLIGFPRIRGEGDLARLRELLKSSSHLQDAGVDIEEWQQEIACLPKGFATVFLLTLLPNLKWLHMPPDWGIIVHPGEPGGVDPDRFHPSPQFRKAKENPNDDPSASESVNAQRQRADIHRRTVVWAVLDSIVRHANDPSTRQNASLSRLAHIRPSQLGGYESRGGLGPFAPFLALHSLETFQSGDTVFLDDGYTGRPFEPHYTHYSPNLHTIEMVGCVTRARELSLLLSRVPRLRIFRFAYESKWHGCGHDWDVGAFFAAVQAHCGATLEELSISRLEGWTKGAGRGTTLTDMGGFRRLKVLEVEVGMLRGPAYDADSTLEEWRLEQSPPGPPALRRLVDLLPPGVETVRLHTSSFDEEDVRCLRALVRGFKEGRGAVVPRLRAIGLHYHWKIGNLEESDVQACLREVEGAGLAVVPEEQQTTARRAAVHPEFVGRFLNQYFPVPGH